MYQNLDLFRVAGQMAVHAGKRQANVAVNVANADTPAYEATRLARFSEVYRPGSEGRLKTTRTSHLTAGPPSSGGRPSLAATEPSPNGNTVSLELEMLESVDASREHSRALAIYRHAMTVVRASIGPMK
jgi:flagellar basal-body rod protein FlgB